MPTTPDSVTYTQSVTGFVQPVTPRPANTGLAPLTQVACVARQKTIPDNIIDDTTNSSMNTRMIVNAPSTSDITDLVLAFPQFYENAPEANFPVTPYTVASCAIEYPAGTFYQGFFDGLSTATVNAGRGLIKSDPIPVYIPAGATFYVKCHVDWVAGHFPLSTFTACSVSTDWTERGIGLADQTLTTSTRTTTSSVGGFSPAVYGRMVTPQPIVGIIGDSISVSTAARVDPTTSACPFEAAFVGRVPVINVSKAGDSMAQYVTRNDGRTAMLRDSITHLIVSMGRNDMSSATTALTNLQTIIKPFIARGVKCYAVTVTPYTSSTDNWTTISGQTYNSAAQEAQRQTYNTSLRANWATYGLSGILDWAYAVDPTNSGYWPAGENAGINAVGFSTLTNGVVTSVARGSYNIGGTTGGTGFPAGATIPCVVTPLPGDRGGGAVVTANVDSSGIIATFNVVSGGSGYQYPPLVAPYGQWTGGDGIHPSARAWHQMIAKCGIGPSLFSI